MKRYPILYAVDANGLFGTIVESARLIQTFDGSLPELIVVGIGYPVGHFFDAVGLRVMDLTPTEDPALTEGFLAAALPYPPPDGSGGGPAFLRFIKEELSPLLDSEYRTDTGDRALLGHSLGGLFAFYALLAGEGFFQRFIISSPAFWWGNNYSFAKEAAFARTSTNLFAKVFLGLGGLESDDAALGISMRMRSNFIDMVSQLTSRRYEGLELASHIFDNETHNSVIGPAINRGLRFVYAQ